MAANVGKAVVDVEVQGPALRLRALELAVEVGKQVDEIDFVDLAQTFVNFLEGK